MEYQKKKISLFEDDPMLGEMWKTKLEQAGYTISLHVDPSRDPVSIVLTDKPNLILMSIIMPVMDGLEATKRLQADDRTKEVPIIALTNLSQQEQITQGMELGMTHYLVSSHYGPKDLITFVNDFFANAPGLKGDEREAGY